jgi:hypothetical protein
LHNKFTFKYTQGATPPLRRVQLLRRLGEARGEARARRGQGVACPSRASAALRLEDGVELGGCTCSVRRPPPRQSVCMCGVWQYCIWLGLGVRLGCAREASFAPCSRAHRPHSSLGMYLVMMHQALRAVTCKTEATVCVSLQVQALVRAVGFSARRRRIDLINQVMECPRSDIPSWGRAPPLIHNHIGADFRFCCHCITVCNLPPPSTLVRCVLCSFSRQPDDHAFPTSEKPELFGISGWHSTQRPRRTSQ